MDRELLKLNQIERPFRAWYGLYCEIDTDSVAASVVIDKMIESAVTLTDYACASRAKLSLAQQQLVIEGIEILCKDDFKLWIEAASFTDVGKFVIDRAIEVIEYADLDAFSTGLDPLNEIEFWPIQARVAKVWIMRACNRAKTTEDILDLYLQQRRHCPTDGSSVWAAGMINNLCSKESDLKFNELLSIRGKIRDGMDPLRKRITSMMLEMSLSEDQWQKI